MSVGLNSVALWQPLHRRARNPNVWTDQSIIGRVRQPQEGNVIEHVPAYPDHLVAGFESSTGDLPWKRSRLARDGANAESLLDGQSK